MSWAEFLIRQAGFERQRKFELFKIREIAWASTIGPHLNPKKLPKTKEQFMPLEPKKPISDTVRERMKQAIEQYKKDVENANKR